MTIDADSPQISVCMATYHGEKYVGEQLQSILVQLGPDDEVVVVDDASADRTVDIIQAIGDPRVRLLRNDVNMGYVRAFEKALGAARGQYLFLADQDDVWPEGRVEVMTHALDEACVVAGNVKDLESGAPLRNPLLGGEWRLPDADSAKWRGNLAGIFLGQRPYYGSAMALHRRLRDTVLPIPRYLSESHDLWIAICGNMARSMRHVDDVVTLRRVHDDNQTPPRPRRWDVVLRARLRLLRLMWQARLRTRRVGAW